MATTQTLMKFDRVAWLTEILSILDESQSVREHLEALDKRIMTVVPYVQSTLIGSTITTLRLLEDALGEVVDAHLAETLQKISTR